MIISDNFMLQPYEFSRLIKEMDELLNSEAEKLTDYYAHRNGIELEQDVFNALNTVAQNTPFEGTIQLVSGASFPDIVAKNYYGVEVKSTNKNQWRSIGSSILESTRIQGVERIFLTFGKLGKPVEFRTRPYEECLYGISVTHYPRYLIDMELKHGETIFDKMGVPYDTLRKLNNPVEPVSRYYKSLLKPGESLWWADSSNLDLESSPATIKLWSTLSPEMKSILTVQGYALFPELLEQGNPRKYNRYSLWLVTKQGVVNTNIRDSFSAGGQIDVFVDGAMLRVPAVFGRIQKFSSLIESTINECSESVLREYWNVGAVRKDRLLQWCELVAIAANSSPNQHFAHEYSYSCVFNMLKSFFGI
jgi:hypothetical protein